MQRGLKEEGRRDVALAHRIAWFMREPKLKRLDHYLKSDAPKRRQSPAEMLAVLRGMQAEGAPIEITAVGGE